MDATNDNNDDINDDQQASVAAVADVNAGVDVNADVNVNGDAIANILDRQKEFPLRQRNKIAELLQVYLEESVCDDNIHGDDMFCRDQDFNDDDDDDNDYSIVFV